MTDFADRPRVFVKVVTLDADGYRRGYEDEIVLEPDTSYGDFLGWVDESIDRAIDDPEGQRWRHEETVALAITRYADARSAGPDSLSDERKGDMDGA